jgi:hypothetical protein
VRLVAWALMALGFASLAVYCLGREWNGVAVTLLLFSFLGVTGAFAAQQKDGG